MRDPIPDAPWIREAERFGFPALPPIRCPCCGEGAETFYIDSSKEVIGCDHCVQAKDAWEYEPWHDEGE